MTDDAITEFHDDVATLITELNRRDGWNVTGHSVDDNGPFDVPEVEIELEWYHEGKEE